MSRYDRQARLPQIGPAGQDRLAASRVAVVGCGALGSTVIDHLARAGVGFLRLIDRDVVELSNLHRQTLFAEADVNRAKADAAAERVRAVNSAIAAEPAVVDLRPINVEPLTTDVDLIVDGTDNAETRYLLNDVAVKHRIPWVYGGCVGVDGRVTTIIPNETACLRCLFPTPPADGELPTCETAGVLGPAVGVVASLQAAAAVRWITARDSEQSLISIDVWTGRCRHIDTSTRSADCPCCADGSFDFLDRLDVPEPKLCGRNAVQVWPAGSGVDLKSLASKLATVGVVESSRFLVRLRPAEFDGISLTIFPDGRTIVTGTTDPARARSLVSRYVGR